MVQRRPCSSIALGARTQRADGPAIGGGSSGSEGGRGLACEIEVMARRRADGSGSTRAPPGGGSDGPAREGFSTAGTAKRGRKRVCRIEQIGRWGGWVWG